MIYPISLYIKLKYTTTKKSTKTTIVQLQIAAI